MSVGGRVIEIASVTLVQDGAEVPVVRLWVVDRDNTELCVYAAPALDMPKLGEEIWWTSGKILFGHNRKALRKIGYSFRPGADHRMGII